MSISPTPPTLAGLTDAQVQERIASGRTNRYDHKNARGAWQIVKDNVFTVFNVTLFLAVVATLAAGLAMSGPQSNVIGDVIFSGASVWANMVVGIVQELWAKRKLDQLAALSVKKARVRRNNQVVEVAADDIVIDDLVLLEPGDRVPVDGPVVESRALEMDESLLTGESDSVSKAAGDAVMSGTFCLAGSGVIRADKIGADSYANRLTSTARGLKQALTPLQLKLNLVVQVLVVLMVIVVVLQLVAAANTGVATVDAMRYTLVIVTSFVPAGLILANTVSLSVGAVTIARFNTLVQRVNAIESMGNVTVLCTDKTGTLTRNRLSVQEVVPLGDYSEAAAVRLLSLYAHGSAAQNKTAGAIAEYAGPTPRPAVEAEIPFSSARKWGALTLVGDGAPSDERTLVLGSPELILDPDDPETARARAVARKHTEQALRVVALVASPASVDGSSELPERRKPVALAVLQDEIRPDIADTMSAFADQGVRIKVISGDSADTVRAIAQRSGLANTQAITEMELAPMQGPAFDAAVRTRGLFARITPETKQRIVASLSRQGEYVAMVGDGVNDVPALKQARLGVSMNDGAQITKDVSELVLLNNALSTLPRALKEGQRISQKILASSRLYLAKNAITILAFLLIGYVALPFPAEPRQVSWVATMTVSIPCTLLAFGLLRPGFTRRFSREVLGYSILLGSVGGVALTAAYILEYALGGDLVMARAVFTFASLHFSTHVFWDVHDVSVFSPASLRKRPREFLAGLGLLIAGIGVPELLPGLFNSVRLGASGWLIGLLLPLVGALFMRAVVYGAFTRNLLRALRK
jgi:cation-transporting ATPase E